MQLMNEQQFHNVKFKELSKKQKVLIISFIVSTIAFIFFLYFFSDNFEHKTKKMVGYLIILAFVFFLLIDIFLLIFPDKESRISAFIKNNSFLFNFDFRNCPPIYTKETSEFVEFSEAVSELLNFRIKNSEEFYNMLDQVAKINSDSLYKKTGIKII